MPDKDAEGFRLRPDGQRSKFNVMVNPAPAPPWSIFLSCCSAIGRTWVDVVIVSVADAFGRAVRIRP